MKIPKIKIKKKIKKTSDSPKPIENKKKKKINIKNIVLITLFSLGIMGSSAVLAFALYIIISSPDFVPSELYNKEATIIYASDGSTEIARYGNENVELATYSDLPQVLIDALVATEDSRFFQHKGFDAARFLKASLGQLAGQNAGGASTLSMQVIKNKFSTKETEGLAGIIRKFSDIYMSVFKLEAVYTKEEIIEFYLNSQWLSGGSTYYGSITGVEQGSQHFFGKSVSDLTLPEASLLVGMFNNPVYFNPYDHPEEATNRRSTVLNLMVRHGYINEAEKEYADSVPVESLLVEHKNDTKSEYQAFIDFVILQVQEETGDNPFDVPMAIYTTIDPNIQNVLHQLETGKTNDGKTFYNFRTDKIQFGMAVTDVKTGAILALSGGRNYTAKGLNRAVSTKYRGIKRQPGSTAKPIFDYGPYLEYIDGASTGTIFIDRPWTYTNNQGIANYDRSYKGAITMRYALMDSRNVPAVQAFQQVANEVGMDKIGDFAHSLGIDYGDTLYESYAIGGGIYTDPLTMSAAYSAFGRGGYYIEPYAFTKVVYLETDEEWNHPVERTKVMSEETAYMITDMLVSGGYAGVGGNFSISGTQIAAKGGTTTMSNADCDRNGIPHGSTPDHWNITYSPDYSIALWYGYDNNKLGHIDSNQGAVDRTAIMKAVATRIYKKNSTFKKPSGVIATTVERDTYPTKLASSHTPSGMKLTELYKSGYEPSETSSRFDTLSDPINGNSNFDGSKITISWDPIDTPSHMDSTKVEEIYNESEYWKFYERFKSDYYKSYINYNTNNLGMIGYQVYLENPSDPEHPIDLGFTTNTTFTYNAVASITDYNFIVKSTYSIFKDNMSPGIKINAQAKIDNNIGNIGGPTDPDEPNTPEPDDPTNNNGLE